MDEFRRTCARIIRRGEIVHGPKGDAARLRNGGAEEAREGRVVRRISM